VWLDDQRAERDRHWPAVERLLAGLPARFFQQAKLVEYDLALRHSDTGQFRDVFLGRSQFPLLSVGPWLLHDLPASFGAAHEAAEGHLFVAALLVAARTHTVEAMLDPYSFYDSEHEGLVDFLTELASIELGRTPPAVSDDPDASDHVIGRWSAGARTVAAVALAIAERGDLEADVGAMLDNLAAGFQIRDDLRSMHHDLLAGRPTYPIAAVADRAAISLHPWPDPLVLLGSAVTTGAIEAILETAIGRLGESRLAAEGLGLATFAAFAADAQASFEDRLLAVRRGVRTPSHEPLIAIAEPTLRKATVMAEGYLLADRSFRETWETHREGMFGEPLVMSRFPVGLVLEILAAHGHDLSAEVDAFLDFTAKNGFRYFDHPSSDPDTDTVGVYLRLMRRGSRRAHHVRMAEPILACLARQVDETGAVPVWLPGCLDRETERPAVLDLGEGCGTVAAHLLLGLIDADAVAHAETIERGSTSLLGRIAEVGLGANVNYPPLYALVVFLRLTARLVGGEHSEATDDGVARARTVLSEILEGALRLPAPTAQEAALLTIACLENERRERVDPRWRITILKRQRFDGGWPGEPFAAAPNRGQWVTWYSSAILTSAICYDALRRSSDA
jgi:hypothetical protein